MTEVRFQAFETTRQGRLQSADYIYRRQGEGWEILRQGRPWLELGPGYELVRTRSCGICSTDLFRHQLPFPLPQIAGHEVVGQWQGHLVAMDINAAHRQRGIGVASCPWCNSGLANHCPERLTLGIDRLPGGFAPWLLVPRHGLYVLPAGVDPTLAVLAEPLAAALRALERTPPDGGHLAIIGAGRLGLLLLAVLAARRRQDGGDYTLTVVLNRNGRQSLCRRLGADRCIDSHAPPPQRAFSIVYDTSGTAAGLDWALAAAERVVHLKSTSGRPAAGLINPTALVINELSIASAADTVPGDDRQTVADPASLERLLAAGPGAGAAALHPGGFLLLQNAGSGQHPLGQAIVERGLQLHSSRCGNIAAALQFLQARQELAQILRNAYLTHVYDADELPLAMAACRQDAQAIKVMIQFGAYAGDNS